MGSYSSTRWRGYTKKKTAETCVTLDVNGLVKHGIGTENMMRAGWCSGSIDQRFYFEFINQEGDTPTLLLEELQVASAWDQTITFLSTEGTYGGLRWWFTCPACQRRVGKLYLPSGAEAFACRNCHQLTYTSAQTAHQYDRRKDAIGSIGQSMTLLKKAEKAQARVDRYQRWCKGKREALIALQRVIEELRDQLDVRDV